MFISNQTEICKRMIYNSIGVNTQINLPIVIVTGMATSVAEAVRKNRDASGLAVIISNDYGTTPGLENLIGTVKDGEKMNSAFKFLKFAAIWQHNVTGDKLTQILHDISQYPGYPRSYKCNCLCVFWPWVGCKPAVHTRWSGDYSLEYSGDSAPKMSPTN